MPRTADSLLPYRDLTPGSFKLFMSARELSRASGISENYIRSRIKSGNMPGFNSGNKFLINTRLFLEQMDEESRKGADHYVE